MMTEEISYNRRMPINPTAGGPAPVFPEDLGSLPENARVTQAFGWAPANWGFGLLLFGSLVFTQPAKPSRAEYIGAAAVMVFGLVLLIYEFRRRKRPKVLGRFSQYNQIGLYKRSKLDRVVEVESVNLVLYHPGRTWGPIMALSLTTIVFAVFLIPSSMGIPRTEKVYFALASLLFLSFTVSLIKTRLRCEVCMVPYEKRRGSEWIMVRRKDIPLLLSRRTQS